MSSQSFTYKQKWLIDRWQRNVSNVGVLADQINIFVEIDRKEFVNESNNRNPNEPLRSVSKGNSGSNREKFMHNRPYPRWIVDIRAKNFQYFSLIRWKQPFNAKQEVFKEISEIKSPSIAVGDMSHGFLKKRLHHS